MDLRPLRFASGADLRPAVEHLSAELPQGSGVVVSGIGSLVSARLRMAGETEERVVEGPLEIISVAGSISPDGAHLHLSVADVRGELRGGHVCFGCEVRTTAELLIAALHGYRLARRFDAGTGFKELVVQPAGKPGDAA